MVRILCIGDSHIPNRAKELPKKIEDKLSELTRDLLFDYTFFTGDVVNFPSILDFLNSITQRNIFIVMGNMDYYFGNKEAPLYQKLDIVFNNKDKLTVGLTHGAQISPRGDLNQLETLAIERNYQILVSGHTHKEEIHLTKDGILLINPGSVTGAWSFVASKIPTFVELNIIESSEQINLRLHQIDKRSREITTAIFYYIFQNNQISRNH
ncbi:MAG: YfcE family phosphodiesterase [Promethearchaeota archaeon]|jgi:putative phosphoesterase